MADRFVGSFIAVLAILCQFSCGGSPATTPTPAPSGPLTLGGAIPLGEQQQTVQLPLVMGTLDVSHSATWQSSDVTVATVSGGYVQAVGLGTVTISASYLNQTASTSITVVPDENCDQYEPTNATLFENANEMPPSWSVEALSLTHGLLELYVAGSDMTDANNLLALFQRYNQFCMIGHNTHNNRPNRQQYTFDYFKSPTGKQTTISPEDCVSYTPNALQVVDQGANGSALMSNGTQLALTDTHFDAVLLATIANQYSNECFVGRGNTRQNPYSYITEYWK
jgi:hypothetical protein